jgi:hypothetical protein
MALSINKMLENLSFIIIKLFFKQVIQMQLSVSLVNNTILIYLLGLDLFMDEFIIIDIDEFINLVSLMKEY